MTHTEEKDATMRSVTALRNSCIRCAELLMRMSTRQRTEMIELDTPNTYDTHTLIQARDALQRLHEELCAIFDHR